MPSFAVAEEVTKILKTFHVATKIVSGDHWHCSSPHPQTSLTDAQGG